VKQAVLASLAAGALVLGLALLEARAEGGRSSEASELATRLALRDNAFGFELLAKLHKEGENLLLSPLSIASALQMASGAATGATRVEMLNAMRVEDLALPEANRALIDHSLARAGKSLALANSLWGNSEVVTLNDAFAEECRSAYSAEVRTLPFADPKSLAVINSWVRERTSGKIPELLEGIPRGTTGYLISAVHFKGSWHLAFDQTRTQEADFTRVGGHTKKVQMMNTSGEYPYVETPDYQAVGLSFGRQPYAVMWFIVPAKGRRLSDVQGLLDAERWKEISAAPRRSGSVSIPRFVVRYKAELTPSLKALGMVRALDPHAADFSRFASSGGRFFIGEVLHDAVLEVNEEGAEAAAATAVKVVAAAVAVPREKPFSFVADRPFFVALVEQGGAPDTGPGAILFAGSVYDPGAEHS
jgi:serpin B